MLLRYSRAGLFFILCASNIQGALGILDYIKPYLPEDPIILEAGAFDGHDSVRMANFWPKGQIHAFEPIPELYKKLTNISIFRPTIQFYPVALGDKFGTMPMYLSAYDTAPGVVSASSSLLPPKDHLIHAPEVLFNKVIDVPVTTIDLWAQQHGIDHVDFLWLDMQGYEQFAIMAAPKILSTVRVILTEVEFVEAYKGQYLFEDIKLFLEDHGFKFIGLVSNYGWCGDALFIR